MNTKLTIKEVRGMLRVAALRPDKLHSQDIAAEMRRLDAAINSGDPRYFLPNCTRETAKNWSPK